MNFSANPSTKELFGYEDREKLEHINNLIRAAGLWVGKDRYDVEGDLGQQLTKVRNQVELGRDQLLDSSEFCRSTSHYEYIIGKGQSVNPMNTIKHFNQALKMLENIENHSSWDNYPHIKNRIYDKGDGSNYESGSYRTAGVSNALDALRELIKECKNINQKIR